MRCEPFRGSDVGRCTRCESLEASTPIVVRSGEVSLGGDVSIRTRKGWIVRVRTHNSSVSVKAVMMARYRLERLGKGGIDGRSLLSIRLCSRILVRSPEGSQSSMSLDISS